MKCVLLLDKKKNSFIELFIYYRKENLALLLKLVKFLITTIQKIYCMDDVKLISELLDTVLLPDLVDVTQLIN